MQEEETMVQTLKEKADVVELNLKCKLGDANFSNLMIWAFEYACKEAEIWGIPRTREDFKKVCESRRSFVILEVNESLRYRRFNHRTLNLPDYEQIDRMLCAEYHEQKRISLKISGNEMSYIPRDNS